MRAFALRDGGTAASRGQADDGSAPAGEEFRGRIGDALQAGFDREVGRLTARRAAQAEAQLAEAITHRIEAESERIQDRIAQELDHQAAFLQAQLEGIQQKALRARADADERVRKADELRAEADASLAATEAIGERLHELAEALYDRHAESLLGKPVERSTSERAGENGSVDVNEATAAQLRGLNLSHTQATRLIRYRDELDGFTSLEQLDEVPGFSKALRDEFKRHVTL